ncbi:hypothetical protein KQ51_01310 [Candidatus Izimaplasma bacterium HR1]|jgi:heme/copper-type cytochrome/quinol oxidase subunit 2|uniref:DUF5058 family protein n=1 Tax=Candidatus Izimoplasma sp. HR1 TaxID=1541959 RepID=UPI0004F8F2E5|nr:hypothetical protein KQ51_01310 [Candidatus Izimaplasma bacterium HR1]
MDFYDLVNSSLLYILVSIVIAFVFFLAFYFAKKAWNRALELGYSKKDLWKVIKSTITATIVPSIAIVIGLFTLVASLGVPFPWLRLSVIGSVAYELVASETATNALLGESANLAEANVQDLVTVMFVMTAAITSGLFTLLFFGKKIQSKVDQLGSNKTSFGFVAIECLMVALAATFLPAFLMKDWTSFLTFFTSLVITVSFGVLSMKVKRLSWVKDFVLALALLGGMASSILWLSWLG